MSEKKSISHDDSPPEDCANGQVLADAELELEASVAGPKADNRTEGRGSFIPLPDGFAGCRLGQSGLDFTPLSGSVEAHPAGGGECKGARQPDDQPPPLTNRYGPPKPSSQQPLKRAFEFVR